MNNSRKVGRDRKAPLDQGEESSCAQLLHLCASLQRCLLCKGSPCLLELGRWTCAWDGGWFCPEGLAVCTGRAHPGSPLTPIGAPEPFCRPARKTTAQRSTGSHAGKQTTRQSGGVPRPVCICSWIQTELLGNADHLPRVTQIGCWGWGQTYMMVEGAAG